MLEIDVSTPMANNQMTATPVNNQMIPRRVALRRASAATAASAVCLSVDFVPVDTDASGWVPLLEVSVIPTPTTT